MKGIYALVTSAASGGKLATSNPAVLHISGLRTPFYSLLIMSKGPPKLLLIWVMSTQIDYFRNENWRI